MPFDGSSRNTNTTATFEIAVLTSLSPNGEFELSPPLSERCHVFQLNSLCHTDVGALILIQSDGVEDGVRIIMGKLSQTPQQLVRPINKAFSLRGESNDEPLIFQAGKSRLELQPYGKIRLVSDDVQLRARRHMDVQGAWIDLN